MIKKSMEKKEIRNIQKKALGLLVKMPDKIEKYPFAKKYLFHYGKDKIIIKLGSE